MSSLIEEIIADLTNSDKPLLSSRLTELSNLNSEGLRYLEQAWVTIEPQRRRRVIYQLVELANDNFELNFNSIFRNCLKDQDAEVRNKAIEGLWESEETSLINSLIDLLEQDSSEKVQVAAAIALGKFTMLAEHNKLRPCHASKVCQALLTAINDKSKGIEVKRRALEAAAPLTLPQVKKAIVEAYHGDNLSLKISSVYAMGKNCDHPWLPLLLKELASADAEMRYEAAGACGELGEKEAVPYLIPFINDPDAEVQLAAIQALGKIGGNETKDCLKQCINNPKQAISQAADEALTELEAEENSFSFPV